MSHKSTSWLSRIVLCPVSSTCNQGSPTRRLVLYRWLLGSPASWRTKSPHMGQVLHVSADLSPHPLSGRHLSSWVGWMKGICDVINPHESSNLLPLGFATYPLNTKWTSLSAPLISFCLCDSLWRCCSYISIVRSPIVSGHSASTFLSTSTNHL